MAGARTREVARCDAGDISWQAQSFVRVRRVDTARFVAGTIKIGVGGTRAEPLQSGRRPRARSLAGGLRLVTEGYIRSPPLPPTLLFDRGDTSARPRVDPRPNLVDRFICILRRMLKNIGFYSVLWPSACLKGRPWCRLCVPRGQA